MGRDLGRISEEEGGAAQAVGTGGMQMLPWTQRDLAMATANIGLGDLIHK